MKIDVKKDERLILSRVLNPKSILNPAWKAIGPNATGADYIRDSHTYTIVLWSKDLGNTERHD